MKQENRTKKKCIFSEGRRLGRKHRGEGFWRREGIDQTKFNKKVLWGAGGERKAKLYTRRWKSTEKEMYLFCPGQDLSLGVA